MESTDVNTELESVSKECNCKVFFHILEVTYIIIINFQNIGIRIERKQFTSINPLQGVSVVLKLSKSESSGGVL